jgi:hypothetical protein
MIHMTPFLTDSNTLIDRKSRRPRIQGVKGEAVVGLRRVLDNAVDGA